MEFYAAVRRSVYVEGLSERAAARRFGLARETVRKMLRYRLPPGYRRAKPIRCPKLDAFTGVIDQILTDDQQRPKKQRHTAKRIWERLCVEHAFTGGYTIVKDYVRRQKLGGQEMFVPLAHPPGDAQADFGEALVVIDGVECKAHYLVVDLPHSDDAFVQAFPAETTEAFCEGHNAAFRYFGGVPRGIVYDNTTLAVAKILGDGTRQRTQSFSELHSHYLFDDRFGRPGKGNDKGKVEGLVGYARRNFFVPVPRVASWDALNADLARQCRARRGQRLRRHTETIGERFARDRAALLPLPPVPYWGAPSFLGHGLRENPMSPGGGGMVRSRGVKGAGSAATKGARRATGVGADAAAMGSGALAPGQRWSASRKRDVVLQLLRGEPLDTVSREVGVEVYRLERWKTRALAGLELGLKEQAGEPLAAELDAAKRHIGDLSMENELLRSRARAAERRLPLATRRSRR